MSSTRRDFMIRLAGSAATLPLLPGERPAQEPRQLRIRIGQIGVGHAHASKLSVYRASDDYEVVGIVEPDPALRKAAESDPVYQGLPWMTQA